jgi:acetylornithine deacetylase
LLFRIVGDADEVWSAIQPLADTVDISEVLRVPPVRLHTLEGFESAVFPFTTDVPLLGAWGTPLLFGPGSFLVAHTDEEHLRLDELAAAVDTYVRLAETLLGGGQGTRD